MFTALIHTTALLVALLPPAVSSPTLQDRSTTDLQRFTLAEPAVVDGVHCDRGYLWRFAADGRLHRCTIDRDEVIHNAALPKGSTVAFNADGTSAFVFLPRTTMIEGYACRGSGHGFMTQFHENGALKLCWMPDNRVIRNVPCAGFSVWSDILRARPSGVYFHDNGQLSSCRLSTDVTIDGVTLKKDQRIELDAQGRRSSTYSSRDVPLN